MTITCRRKTKFTALPYPIWHTCKKCGARFMAEKTG
jgi:hypothetical protein